MGFPLHCHCTFTTDSKAPETPYCLLLLTFGLNLLVLGNDDGLSGRVTGVVIDKANGETLIGVPVMIEGTTLGAVTDPGRTLPDHQHSQWYL